MNLNVGAHHPEPEWVNVDIEPGCDLRGDVVALPFPDATFARVLASHILEHLDPDRVPAALNEIRRVTSPGGLVLLRGPDCDRDDSELARDGAGTSVVWAHRWACTQARLERLAAAYLTATHEEPDGSWPTSRTWTHPESTVLARR